MQSSGRHACHFLFRARGAPFVSEKRGTSQFEFGPRKPALGRSEPLCQQSRRGIADPRCAREQRPTNIRVNAVAPGPTETDLLPDDTYLRDYINSRTPLGRAGLPGDIAKVVAFLASDNAQWINGQVISADGGIRI